MDTHVSGRHGEMRERDLDVQRRGHDVRNQQEDESTLPVGDGLVHNTVDEPIPKESLTSKLKPYMPPGWSFSRGLALQQVLVTQSVEVEAGQHHNRIVTIVLDFDHDLRERIESHVAVVVSAVKVVEEAMRDGKEGNVLDIWVVLRFIGDDMVDIVTPFPPAQTQSTHEIGNDDPNDRVHVEIVGDTHMTSIMSSEDKLVPEAPEEKRRSCPPTKTKKYVG